MFHLSFPQDIFWRWADLSGETGSFGGDIPGGGGAGALGWGGGGWAGPAVQVERELSWELASAVGWAPFGELAPALGGPGGDIKAAPRQRPKFMNIYRCLHKKKTSW